VVLTLALVSGASVWWSAPAAAGGPPYDDFTEAGDLGDLEGSTAHSSNVGGTVQPGEPDANGSMTLDNTIWYRWTPAHSGRAIFTTDGSGFDTQVAVYSGTSLTGLTLVDYDDDGGAGTASRLEFDAVQGTQYRIQIDGFSGASGTTQLNNNPVRFFDVHFGTNPFYVDVDWVAAEEIAGGYPDGSFRPSANISRQAMAAFLVRFRNMDPAGPITPTFSDVPTSHPFYEEIETLVALEITNGYQDGTFRPGGTVTRQSMAAFLHRATGNGLIHPGAPDFSDVSESHPFYFDIEWMAHEGVTTGYPDGTFRPSATVARGPMAAFLHRASLVGGA
jgi:hypothetical protein